MNHVPHVIITYMSARMHKYNSCVHTHSRSLQFGVDASVCACVRKCDGIDETWSVVAGTHIWIAPLRYWIALNLIILYECTTWTTWYNYGHIWHIMNPLLMSERFGWLPNDPDYNATANYFCRYLRCRWFCMYSTWTYDWYWANLRKCTEL